MNITSASFSYTIDSVEFTIHGYDTILNKLRPDNGWELVYLNKDLISGSTTITFMRYVDEEVE